MNSTTYSEFEDWLPRPAALRLAFALWILGFALAGATTWRLHRAGPEATERSTAANTEATQAAESSEPAAVEVIPEDVVIGHRATRTGATLRQKP